MKMEKCDIYTVWVSPTVEQPKKCDIDLLLADDSTKHALGRIDNVMIELHMTLVHVYFIIMDMRSNTSSPIILGRPFL
jgi:hypothetical protein